jgi:hypothetical protein
MEDTNKPIAKASSKGDVYKISPRHEHRLSAVTLNKDGERINLMGKTVVLKREPTEDDPRTEISVRGATQDELREHFEKGMQDFVIRVRD